MSYPINYPTPQGANFQAFYGGGLGIRDWVKPQGASMVRMLLIGAGGNGSGATTGSAGGGGGSGAVTTWIGPAMFVPNVLRIQVGRGGGSSSTTASSQVIYQQRDTAGYILLRADGGSGGSTGGGGAGGAAFTNNYFGAAGIFNSIAGQSGTIPGTNVTASTTTFLSGGAGAGISTSASGATVNSKYGYPSLTGGAGTTGGVGSNGYFLTQPIMVGFGGSGGGGSTTGAGGNGGRGGIGCGGGGGGLCTSGASTGGAGGDGAVFIWSW